MRPFAQTSDEVVGSICALAWGALSVQQLTDAAWSYYFFSIQFRQNLLIARRLHPDDPRLAELEAEECHTANLSPFRGVAATGERMDHDEFMRRALALAPIAPARRKWLCEAGGAYLHAVAALDDDTRALSMVSYEGGGLERVFRSMLTAPDWDGPVLLAFRHFLEAHIRLDDHHGALVHHLEGEDRAVPLWVLFRELLLKCVPALSRPHVLPGIAEAKAVAPAAALPGAACAAPQPLELAEA